MFARSPPLGVGIGSHALPFQWTPPARSTTRRRPTRWRDPRLNTGPRWPVALFGLERSVGDALSSDHVASRVWNGTETLSGDGLAGRRASLPLGTGVNRRRPDERSRAMHVRGHLREAFTEWVEGGCVEEEVGSDIFRGGRGRPLRWLFGQLWRCTDTMPWDLCTDLGVPRGST